MTKGFYFSYTYDLTKTLQENIYSCIVTKMNWDDEDFQIDIKNEHRDVPKSAPFMDRLRISPDDDEDNVDDICLDFKDIIKDKPRSKAHSLKGP